jgi:Putative auto-transporter adhesin, head GIN domain
MKTLLLLFFMCAPLWVFAGSDTELRAPGHFTKIHLTGNIEKVDLVADDRESVYIESEGISTAKVETTVCDGVLYIHVKEGAKDKASVRLTITYRQLKEVQNYSTAEVEGGPRPKGAIIPQMPAVQIK